MRDRIKYVHISSALSAVEARGANRHSPKISRHGTLLHQSRRLALYFYKTCGVRPIRSLVTGWKRSQKPIGRTGTGTFYVSRVRHSVRALPPFRDGRKTPVFLASCLDDHVLLRSAQYICQRKALSGTDGAINTGPVRYFHATPDATARPSAHEPIIRLSN